MFEKSLGLFMYINKYTGSGWPDGSGCDGSGGTDGFGCGGYGGTNTNSRTPGLC
jgi:hypothetical protein